MWGQAAGNSALCRDLINPWFTPQGCYEKVKLWFDDNKHVLGTVGMCILIMQVRGLQAHRPLGRLEPEQG